jgi:demethylmenaquinone methyltransferase/2-methoxy-6-polyprenyl-1,4-benzoquinol methylase
LDCSIGTGAFSLALAGKVAAPVRIERVDISPSMLLRASLDLDRAGIEARLHLRDVKDLPFEEDAFEAVIGARMLERLLHPFAGLSEMARILKPGGPLVIVMISRSMPDALLRVKWCHEHIELERLVIGVVRQMGIPARGTPSCRSSGSGHSSSPSWQRPRRNPL